MNRRLAFVDRRPLTEIEVTIVDGRITERHANGDPSHLDQLAGSVGW